MPPTSEVYRQPYNALQDEIVRDGRAVCLVFVRRYEGVYKDEKRIVPDADGERYATLIQEAILNDR